MYTDKKGTVSYVQKYQSGWKQASEVKQSLGPTNYYRIGETGGIFRLVIVFRMKTIFSQRSRRQ